MLRKPKTDPRPTDPRPTDPRPTDPRPTDPRPTSGSGSTPKLKRFFECQPLPTPTVFGRHPLTRS